jgi:Tat protein translocase TatB subunit
MNLGFSGEVFFIMLLALILFGPRKLPELARQAGRLMAEFRKVSNHVQNQIQAEISQLEMETADPVKELAPVLAQANAALQNVSLTGALDRLTDPLVTVPGNARALDPNDKSAHNSPSV